MTEMIVTHFCRMTGQSENRYMVTDLLTTRKSVTRRFRVVAVLWSPQSCSSTLAWSPRLPRSSITSPSSSILAIVANRPEISPCWTGGRNVGTPRRLGYGFILWRKTLIKKVSIPLTRIENEARLNLEKGPDCWRVYPMIQHDSVISGARWETKFKRSPMCLGSVGGCDAVEVNLIHENVLQGLTRRRGSWKTKGLIAHQNPICHRGTGV
jgi:hypothetical protein